MTIALWCLFAAGLLHLFSKAPLIKAQNSMPGGYDNHFPREQQAQLSGWGKRALAAHENQIESFPIFAAGVLVAMVAGVTSAAVDYLAIVFILARVLFITLYIKDVPTLRSSVWGVGFLSSLALLCSPAWA